MAIYKSAELLKMISEIINEGYKYVDVNESEGFEDEDGDGLPLGLSFEAIDEDLAGIDFECVNSCDFPTESDITTPEHFHADDFCGTISFTYGEILTIKQSLGNSLEYFKEISNDPETSKDMLSDVKTASITYRNLQAKLAKFLKGFKIS
ncbi:hypothetical protein [Clostridium sp. HBUAS56010]|uniref:hypothetical protein n=1 Tax=Clostridium sp. HBUAS56010 TaxID=2571127 RepID=UPI001177857E|nr:hypothetical protein [Clostridium sp. HBUAS56010]